MTWTEETHVWWHVVYFLNYSWSHLSDMHINKKAIVSVYLGQLLWSKVFGVNVMLNITVFMRQDYVWMSMMVSWGIEINDL